MSAVRIVDVSVATAFGDGLDPLWNGLMAGNTALGRVERFPTDAYLAPIGGCAPGLKPVQSGSLVEELLDRVLDGLSVSPPTECRVLTATTKGGVDILERLHRGGDKPSDALLLGRMPQMVAERFALRDGGVNISAACASSTIALSRAAALIAAGQAQTVLVCCADLLSEFVFSGFSALQGLSPKAARPFDRRRDGLSLGEGAAAVLLASAEWAEKNGHSPLATIRGWGVSNDANHITAPARDGSGLTRAIRQALGKAGLEADAVGAVSAHGTATLYNDAMELTAFRAVFGERPLPVQSVKGAIGHTLGAAGGIEAALAVKMLREKTVPPTVGFEEPDDGARRRVSSQPQGIDGGCLMSVNSGFGGVNAALIMEGATE